MQQPTKPTLPSALKHLVLGSTSPFRRELLERLGVPFLCDAPQIVETRQVNEAPQELVMRLSEEKALEVGHRNPESLVFGSDQVACLQDGAILGKPHTYERAIEQLKQASGNPVCFYTGLTLYNTQSGRIQSACETYRVHFRQLSETQIERYIALENPLNCAGSFKSEGLGITLFSSLHGNDPNTLIGLPLIRLIDFLSNEGLILP